jgi:hypothetical protein
MSVASSLPANATNLRIIIPLTYYENISSFHGQLSYPLAVVIL